MASWKAAYEVGNIRSDLPIVCRTGMSAGNREPSLSFASMDCASSFGINHSSVQLVFGLGFAVVVEVGVA